MQAGIKKLLDKVDKNINDFSTILKDENSKLDETDINFAVKHILEDMQSILDYCAVDIHNIFCSTHSNKKIYYLYSDENETEVDYIKRINKNFPNLYTNHNDIYNEMAKTQWFYDNTKWLIKLNGLTNEVKHNELYIVKVKKEKNTVMKSDDASMLIKGEMNIQKMGNGYGFYEGGSVYVDGDGVGFYGDGTIVVGNGTYNVDTKKTHNLSISIYYENIVKSKKYDEDIIVLLKLIFEKEFKLISNLEKFI